MAPVEHGLIDEVRVVGDPPGWTIDERLHAHHTPAVSIAIIHEYRVVFAKAYGWSDLETHQRATPDTLFQAASISKMVTALAALEQVEAGRVALDANINDALRSWKLPENELTRATPVTLAQLLSHTAGVNMHTVDGTPEGGALPSLRQVLEGQAPATNVAVRVEHPPGREFLYSGGGLLIVQQLLEDLTGLPFEDAMQRAVFTPLGMRGSSFAVPLPDALKRRRAVPYDTDETPLPALVYREAAPAGMWTTPTDLARFLIEVQLATDGRSKLISKQVATWLTTGKAPIGVPDVLMGMGSYVEKHGALTYFGHDGWNDGFLSMSRAMLKRGDGAVVMTNGAGGAQVLFEVMRSIAVAYDWQGWLPPPLVATKLSHAQLAAFVGRYRKAGAIDGSLVVAVRRDRLSGKLALRAALELIPVGDALFVNRADGAHFAFSGNELVITRHDEREVLVKTADDVEPSALLEAARYDDALAAYRAANPKDPNVSESYLDALGRELLDRRFDLPNALRVFRINAALHAESANANAAVAYAYMRNYRLSEGEPYYERALQLRAQNGTPPEMEGVYLNWRLSRFKAALR